MSPTPSLDRPAAAARPDGTPDEARLTVCMLAACPFPANHGTPGSIREMAEAVAERGHDVHVVTYHFGEAIPVRGPTVHRIPPLTGESSVVVGPTVRRPLYDLQMVFKTLQVIREHQPDLLHAHGYEAALVAWVCRLLTGVPIVYSGHMTMADELPTYNFIRPRWLARALGKVLDAVVPRVGDRCIPHSTNMDRFLRGLGLGARTEPVLHKGVDLDVAAGGDGEAVRRRYGLAQRPVVVYAGVLDEFQRVDLLLEAMKTVVASQPEARLLLVTTIPHAKHLAAVERQIQALGLARHVVVTEPQPLAELRHFLAAGDVAVVPRPCAPGFPIKVVNYMAARRPCALFASSASGLTHRVNAFLVERDTGPALGEAVLELLGDVGLRQRLAEEAYRYVREHRDRRVTARQVCDSYFRTLATARRWAPAAPRVPAPLLQPIARI
jgi:glycosyltransferase involved in cell wall biosynthesis